MEMHFPQIPFICRAADRKSQQSQALLQQQHQQLQQCLAINNTKRLRKLGKTLLGLRKSFPRGTQRTIKTTAL